MNRSGAVEAGAAMEQLLSTAASRRDRLIHSWPAVALTIGLTAAAVTLMLIHGDDQPLVGTLPLRAVSFVLLIWCAVFAAVTLALHAHGAPHWLKRALMDVELVIWSSGLSLLLVLSGGALVMLTLGLMSSFLWPAMPRARRLRTGRLYAAVHLAAIALCLQTGRWTGAMLVFLMMCAVIAVQTMMSRATHRSVRARVERDLAEREVLALEVLTLRERIARELHDGVGADLTGLFLILRSHAERQPALTVLVARAQSALEELRCVSWLLKTADGTVGSLQRHIDSTCRRLCGPVSYGLAPMRSDPASLIGSAAAANAARTARELVRYAAELPGANHLLLRIDAAKVLELTVEINGCGSNSLAGERWLGVQNAVKSASGVLQGHAHSGGLRLFAALPLVP